MYGITTYEFTGQAGLNASTTKPRQRRIIAAAMLLGVAQMTVTSMVAPGTASAATAAKAKKPSPITITVGENTLTMSSPTASAGVVTFVLSNPSKLDHEIDIVKTLLAPTALPTKPNGQFKERAKELRVVKEAVKIKPGATRTFTAKLAAGHYVVVDNLPGHYKDGEATDLTVS